MRAVVAVLLIALVGCGGGTFFVGVNTNTGATTVVSGSVVIVQLTMVSGGVNVTVVTLMINGIPNTFTFCGSNASLFPINGFVQVNFTPAQPCVSSFVVVKG